MPTNLPGLLTPTFSGNMASRKSIQGGINEQLANLGGLASTSAGQRSADYGTVSGGYRGLLDSGYSPGEKSSISRGTLGGISSAYGGAMDAARRRVAATGNTAGYGGLLRSLTRGKAGAMASQNLANQSAFADEKLKRKMAGLEGIANLFGINTSFLNSMLGQQGHLIDTAAGVYTGTKRPSMGDTFGQALGGGLGSLLTLH